MIEKLAAIKQRYQDVELKLSDPAVISDMRQFKKLNIEYRNLEPVVAIFEEYKKVLNNIESAQEVLKTEKDKD